jgi:WD40 repeat protein
LAIANEADELTVWDALTGRELARMSNDAGGWLHFSPDGSLILVVGQTPTLAFLWDWEAGEEVHRFELIGGAWGADYSPDGRLVAIGEREAGAIVIFDADSGDVVQRIEGHAGLLSDVAFSPDGTRLASSSDIPSRILVNDVATGDELLAMPSPIDAVLELAWSPEGEELAFGGNTGELAIVNAATGQERLRLSGIDSVIHSPAWFPDGNRIAVTGRGVETVVWDVRNQNPSGGALVGPLPAFPAGAWYIRGESAIVAAQLETGLLVYDPDSSTVIDSRTPPGAWAEWPGWPLVSPDRSLVAMSDADGLMTIYDTETLAAIRSFDVGFPIGAFSPDGTSIVVAPRVADRDLIDGEGPGLVDITTGDYILTFDGEKNFNSVLAAHAAFHPSGDYVAVTGPTRVYNTDTGEIVFAAEPWGNALAFSPDGSRFIILTGAGFAHMYDFDAALMGATPEEALVHEWQALDATGIMVRWTEDGSRLLVGGLDERLVVYDGEGKKTLLQVPTGIVGTVDFSEDGKRVLISAEGGPRIISLDTEELLVAARLRLTRGFTTAECARFFPDGGCPTLEDLRAA